LKNAVENPIKRGSWYGKKKAGSETELGTSHVCTGSSAVFLPLEAEFLFRFSISKQRHRNQKSEI
jgi:hypothetical protein